MSAIEQQDSHRSPSDGGMAKGRIYPCRDNALQDCGATETERRVCEETHRMEQRDPATGLRQRITSAAFPSMTASAPYPNTSATVPWSAKVP